MTIDIFKQATKVFFRLLLLRFKPKKQRNVLLVGEYGKSGGARTYFIYLLHFLHQEQSDVTVLINGQHEDDEIAKIIEAYNYKKIRINIDFWCTNFEVIPNGLTKEKLISYQLTELLFWCSLQWKHNFYSIIFSVANAENYLYSFLLPLRISYILHSVPEKQTDRYKQWVLKMNLGVKKQIVTVSEFAKRTIEKQWLQDRTSPHVHYVYNYYLPKYQLDLAPANPVKTVLTIGSVVGYKNPLLFIETAKALIEINKPQTISFIWAGDGNMMEACRAAAANFPQIQFIGNVDNVEALYQQATVYYQPSLLESHGIAVLGAMYHRLPCVVSDNGGLQESVQDQQTGFVVSVNNVEESLEKINALLHDEVLRCSLAENGYKLFLAKFTKSKWEHNMRQVLEFSLGKL